MRVVPPLTVSRIKAAIASAEPAELRDGLVRGLCLRTSKNGHRWSLQLAIGGRNRRFPLGPYPFISLAEARQLALQKRHALKDLKDPTNQTLSTLLAEYEPHAFHLRSWQNGYAPRRIRAVFGPVLDIPLADLECRSLQRVIDAHPSTFSAANAVRQLRPMLKWARKRGLSPIVAEDLEQPQNAIKERARVLSLPELQALLAALTYEGYDLAARLLLLTCVRLNELCHFHRDEVDLLTMRWVIPAERMKAKQPHTVPLSHQASALFSLALADPSHRPFEHLSNWSRWQRNIFTKTNTSGWHRHDLRRTAATILGEQLNVEPYIIDAALAHAHITGNKLARTYNRSRYTPQIAIALQALADFLDTLQ